MMCCTPEMVRFTDDGEWVYVKVSECPPVKHWKCKYGAKKKVLQVSKEGGVPWLLDPDEEYIGSMDPGLPGQDLEKGDTVWAVPHSTLGAFSDGKLIECLVSLANAKDFEDIRRKLSEAGYPDNVLDAGTNPR